MKKVFAVLGFICFLNPLIADEGMWLLTMLEKLNIQQKGCSLTPEQIYSINHSSLKDAILGLSESEQPYNFFCTAELVSPEGLVLTNYHCGFDMIQKHTSITNNYIENGFWAQNKSEELPNQGISATRLVALYDVTDRVFAALQNTKTDSSDVEYDEDGLESPSLRAVADSIKKSVTDTCSYGASIKAMFESNQYFLFIYETFHDVRLVGAPPRTIGKFGDETDNWMWPRHTGDFCVLRVYSDESGLPAEYSKTNKPLSPRHFLPISLQGYEEGDYAMVMGFPGSTDRYRSANDIKYFAQIDNSTIKLIGDVALGNYKKFFTGDSLIKIKYASKYDNLSNYWKYSIGQKKGIVDLQVVDKKQQQEDSMRAWIQADSSRIAKYGTILDTLSNYYSDHYGPRSVLTMLNVGMLNIVEAMMFSYECLPILDALDAHDPIVMKEVQVALKDRAAKFFKDYSSDVDKQQFISLVYAAWYNMGYYIYREKNYPLMKKYKGDVAKYADNLYAKSVFADEQRFYEFIENPTYKKVYNDPMFILMRYTLMEYFRVRDLLDNSAIDSANTLYVGAIMEMYPDSLLYPDANSTLRLTYGSVESYQPHDGMTYHYYTTLAGVLEKKDMTNPEFFVPEKLEQLYNDKDYGQYADKNGELPVCFITNNDITGGNSGSPVMNARGELTGLAFDGNWEAMSGDIIFEPSVQRTIAVDIRYVLWIIDKFAGAGYLLDEMTIIR